MRYTRKTEKDGQASLEMTSQTDDEAKWLEALLPTRGQRTALLRKEKEPTNHGQGVTFVLRRAPDDAAEKSVYDDEYEALTLPELFTLCAERQISEREHKKSRPTAIQLLREHDAQVKHNTGQPAPKTVPVTKK